MLPSGSSDTQSVFRSAAWVNAWVDTWGKDSSLKLIDLGGQANPLECLYTTRQWLKKYIPVNTLCLAGVGCGKISTPRAEYNDINSFIHLFGGATEFLQELKKLSWQQFLLPDVLHGTNTMRDIEAFSRTSSCGLHIQKIEPVYAVNEVLFDEYLQRLGASTRLTYFNRRKNLAQQGVVELIDYDLSTMDKGFEYLNQFHLLRWGRPCYSPKSQSFMKSFAHLLLEQGGRCVLQAMSVNGEVVSVIFDVIWQSTRYNFQSGYAEGKYPKIALGAIHMGYAIEQAIKDQHIYDFMAGTGKKRDYKKHIATRIQSISSFSLERSYLKSFRALQSRIIKKGI